MNDRPGLTAQDTQVRLAAERNLLAWVRTGLSMIGLGFVVAKFGLFLDLARGAGADESSHPDASSWIGTLLVALGVATCVLAAGQHWRFLRHLRQGAPYPVPRWSLAIAMALLLALLGTGIILYLLHVAF